MNPNAYIPAEKIAGVFCFAISKPAEGSLLKVSQRVFCASGSTPLADGTLAEFNTAAAGSTIALPDNVNPVDAAAVGVAGLTAYQSIVPYIKKGDKPFINSRSGGTGMFGIQIAKAMGRHVTTACSTGKVEWCMDMGQTGSRTTERHCI